MRAFGARISARTRLHPRSRIGSNSAANNVRDNERTPAGDALTRWASRLTARRRIQVVCVRRVTAHRRRPRTHAHALRARAKRQLEWV